MRNWILSFLLISASVLWATPIVHPIRVGMLLPLQAETVKRDVNMDRFVDFYSGALLALYEVQSWGQEVELYVYDTGKSTNRMSAVLDSLSGKGVDMVIGPAYPSQVHIMSQWAAQHRVLTLLPFASDVPELSTNPYLMQFNPSAQTEALKLVVYLSNLSRPVNCIFVEAEESKIPENIRMFQHYVKQSGMDYSMTTVREIMHDSLYLHMSSMEDNILVMNTERFSNLRPILRQLGRASESRPLILLSRYSWQEEKIDLKQIYSTVFNDSTKDTYYEALYTGFFTKPRVSSHPCYDLLGYDLMSYVLQTLKEMGNTEDEVEKENILLREFRGVQSDVCFERVGENGGYQNMGIRVVNVQ